MRPLKNLLDLSCEFEDEIKKMVAMQKKDVAVLLFGAGSTSEYILHCFREYGIKPSYFMDNSPDKQGGMISGCPVISVDVFCDMEWNAGYYIYITTQLYYSTIREQLLHAGVEDERISCYDVIPQFLWEKDYGAYFKRNIGCFERVAGFLFDDVSREVLWNRIAFLITRKRDYAVYARGLGNGCQYFDDTVYDVSQTRCMVDCGGYNGDTAEEFFLRSDAEERFVYFFEPDKALLSEARERLQAYSDKVEYIKKATGDMDGIMGISSSFGMMKSIEHVGWSDSNADNQEYFEVCRIDDVIGTASRKIDLLKMDIEGAEMATLHGARAVIERHYPICAVCAYHKADDLWMIIDFLQKLTTEGYSYYLRHYSDNQTETVLYAVPGG